MKAITIIFALFILFSSCKKSESPFLSQAEVDNYLQNLNEGLDYIAYISENDIYYFTDIDNAPIRLTNTPLIEKTNVQISKNGNKIAYLKEDNYPVIIDFSGNVIDELTEFTNITQMDWSEDGSSLYMLIENELFYYGPELNVRDLTFYNVPYFPYNTILSASISKDLDLAYVMRYYDVADYDYHEKLIIKPYGTDVTLEFFSTHSRMAYVDFSSNYRDFVLAFNNYSDSKEYIRLEFYSDYTGISDTEKDYGEWSTPSYRSDLNYVLSGYSDYNYILKATDLSEYGSKDISLGSYCFSEDLIYCDWE
ncbi:MAG: hypothetical protein A2W91_04460 [Bacteroidetes bacterium GWF2_38_335]|nr:MAG: hypothetical protein A2W91_04460 [Bacteroidetes bacterium GWF2_38_335]HBS88240.1 hypothetical protein [Bacteroidales bacterium]